MRRLWELSLLAAGGLSRAPLRAALTSLGVAIATGALVSMVGFALGVQERVEEPFRKMELLNRIDVLAKPPPSKPEPSSGRGESSAVLDDAAVARIASLRGVKLAYPDF